MSRKRPAPKPAPRRRQPPTAGGAAGRPAERRRPAPLTLALAVVVVLAGTALAYWPVLSAQATTYDDEMYLTGNPLVQNPGWDSAQRFFTEVLKPSTVRGYYQPLTMISLMLDYALGGRPEDLTQFHRTNLALHLANAALIVVFLHLLFGNVWAAAAAGLLFGCHPLTIEPVAWLTERKTLLATFFALGSLIVYVWHARRPTWGRLGGCLALMVLSLLSKPTTTPLPLLMILLDYWPLRRLSRRTLLEKAPLLLVAAAFAVITVISQREAAGLKDPTVHGPWRIPLLLCHNIVLYPRQMLWPVNLSWHYPFPEPMDLSVPIVRTGVIGTVLLLTVLLVAWRWTRAPLTSWLFFFVAIFPTMGVIGFTSFIACDKYAYFPATGMLLLLAFGMSRWWHAVPSPGWQPVVRVATVATVLALAGVSTWLTRHYLGFWRDTERLHRYMVAMTPGAYAARYNLGHHLARQGRLDEALREYEQALRVEPNHWRSHSEIGRVLVVQERYAEALPHLETALRLAPDTYATNYNYGIALEKLGRNAEALAAYDRALAVAPQRHEPHLNRGNVLFALGRFDDALAAYDEVLRLRPDHAKGHVNRGLTLARLGRAAEARAALRRALELDPANATAQRNLERLRDAQPPADVPPP